MKDCYNLITEPFDISEYGLIRMVYVDYGTGILFPDCSQLIGTFSIN